MAPPRRRNRMATRRVPNLGRQQQRQRLQKVGNKGQWDSLMSKSQHKVVVICFYRDFNFASRRMHQFLLELSKDKKLSKKTIFVEANPDELGSVGNVQNIQSFPALGFYFAGKLRQLMQGAEPQAIQETVEAHVLEIFGAYENKSFMKWIVGGTIAGTTVLLGALGATLTAASKNGTNGRTRIDASMVDLEFSDSEWSDEEDLGYQSQLHRLQALTS